MVDLLVVGAALYELPRLDVVGEETGDETGDPNNGRPIWSSGRLGTDAAASFSLQRLDLSQRLQIELSFDQ